MKYRKLQNTQYVPPANPAGEAEYFAKQKFTLIRTDWEKDMIGLVKKTFAIGEQITVRDSPFKQIPKHFTGRITQVTDDVFEVTQVDQSTVKISTWDLGVALDYGEITIIPVDEIGPVIEAVANKTMSPLGRQIAAGQHTRIDTQEG